MTNKRLLMVKKRLLMVVKRLLMAKMRQRMVKNKTADRTRRDSRWLESADGPWLLARRRLLMATSKLVMNRGIAVMRLL